MVRKKSAKKPKSKLPQWVKWLWLFISMCLFVAVVYENKQYLHRAFRYFSHKYIKTKVKPTDFPLGYSIHGIDVSHYQTDVNWKKLKAINQIGDTVHFDFVFVKATEGLIIEDAMFDEHWEDARANGITRGAYHYFLPDRSAALQAANFITSVSLKPGDLPPVVDVEEVRKKSKKELVESLKVFLEKLESHYKVKPIIYSNHNFIEDYLADDFKAYPFWMAHYHLREMNAIDSIRLLFWQHSDQSDLFGVRGKVDANVFTGDAYEFKKLLVK